MGLRLRAAYAAAGLPDPELRLESAVGGEEIAWAWANVICGVLPLMEQFGIATAAARTPMASSCLRCVRQAVS